MSTGTYVGLIAQVREELNDIERIVERVQPLPEKALKTGDDVYWDAVALNLHGVYTGMEKVFELVARHVDADVPARGDWHKALLLQMSAGIDDVRPPVIARETRYCLDEYRSFRHVVRNLYTTNLKPARLEQLVDELPECYDAFVRDIERFIAFLQELDEK